ncbi:glycosyl hydrolase family 18 protein [Saccharibacillus kuerlensis]|uniref:GH18 domain-containing protein n=1 Tax=Saccharibacillus kuerlensis TaxID=459527 RepID=A0ABQ2L6G9_9BACL|nr:glycosyl hydrolase family 18 protein [Saccharibacillus kuerlensis]GGO04913.1 hypothetical protein GCM10010969_30670 [Saccharibacillus kuerlensis]
MKKKPILALTLLAACVLTASAFYYFQKNRQVQNTAGSVESPSFNAAPASAHLSAWMADWNWSNDLPDLTRLSGRLDELEVFAAYFDSRDQLYFTPQFEKGLSHIRKAAKDGGIPTTLLTVVNDRFNTDGTAVQKDTQLVSRLIHTKQDRLNHVSQLMRAVKDYGFDGIEIDYEKISKADYGRMVLFIKELQKQLNAEDLKLRVVLEPGMPIETMKLPPGPSYVMMAYNLYGLHSGPGPKADLAFIQKLGKRMDVLPGESTIAFSMGGFDWAASGKVTSMTEVQALETARLRGVSPTRDSKSGSMTYTYLDDKGQSHTVWYADGITLLRWIQAANRTGIYNVAIWRLGGLSSATLTTLSKV